MTSYRKWTTIEEAYLRDNYGLFPLPKLAKQMNRSQKSIASRASFLKLRIDRKKKASVKGSGGRMPPLTLPVQSVLKKHAERANKARRVDPIAGRVPLRIDHKTIIYIPANSSAKDIEGYRSRYERAK